MLVQLHVVTVPMNTVGRYQSPPMFPETVLIAPVKKVAPQLSLQAPTETVEEFHPLIRIRDV